MDVITPETRSTDGRVFFAKVDILLDSKTKKENVTVGFQVPEAERTTDSRARYSLEPITFRNIRVLIITLPGTLPTGTKLALASQFPQTAAHLAKRCTLGFQPEVRL